MEDLGTLGGTNSQATAINISGQIVGVAQSPDGLSRACRFGPANVDLSGGHAYPSGATDINDLGSAVGWIEGTPLSGEDDRVFAVVFQPGTPTVQLLSVVNGYTVFGQARAINNDAMIGGWTSDVAWFSYPAAHASWWRNLGGTMIQFGPIDSYLRGVNAGGQFVGESSTDYGALRAMHWFGLSALNLGSLALGSSTASAINNRGQIVGRSVAYRFGPITNYFPVIILDTNAPPPAPLVYEGYTRTQHAFLWRDGVMVDLNDLIPTNSGWELTEAMAINDAGEIVGNGTHDGQTRAFLLTPAGNPNQPPFIRVRSPADGAWVKGTRIEFEVEANDTDGAVQNVEFFAQRVLKRSATTGSWMFPADHDLVAGPHPPGYLGTARKGSVSYFLDVTNLASGNYLIVAKATDDQGVTSAAAEILVHVNAPTMLVWVRGPWGNPAPAPPFDATLRLQLVNANEELIYDVESSSDLVNWSKVGFIELTPGTLNTAFAVQDVANAPQRFFRAVGRE